MVKEYVTLEAFYCKQKIIYKVTNMIYNKGM